MAKRANASSPKPAGWRRFVRFRPRVWACLFALSLLGAVGHSVWQRQAPIVARHPQFQLTADAIHVTPQPPWIRSDVKAEVIRDAGLIGLSVLDDSDALFRRVKDAFEFHPWVSSVRRIRKRLPSSLDIELEYRQPIAAVELSDASGATLLPVDARGVRLPDADLTDAELRWLPRISGVTGRPLVGDVWQDPRVVSGTRLAVELTDVWHELRLVQIMPSPQPQVRGDERFYTFEITTAGGTRIVWGAAPGDEQAAGESPFADKRRRLLDYVAEHGRLDSINGPALVDVRSELIITPRTVRRQFDAATISQ